MSDIVVTIPGEPTAKGRARIAKTGRAYTPAKTRNAEAYARHCIVAQVGQPMLEGPLEIDIIAVLPIPASWARKKQQDALAGIVRPVGRPDLDNYLKLYSDAANGILWRDDSQIVAASLSKAYGDKPGVVLTVRAA